MTNALCEVVMMNNNDVHENSSLMNTVSEDINMENEKMKNKTGVEGRILADRFRLIKMLGSGGMSTVYLAENINLGTFWAIKQIPKGNKNGPDILVEPTILKKLNHPSLPRIIDIIEDDNNLYIVQDYIEGTPLDKELEKVGKFPLGTVLQWSLQICDVLIYLHEFKPNPIIYRDMKPGNIILTPWNEIKLVDFGIAREYKEGRNNDTVYIGTKGYAAPEQYGDGQTSVATDIYCLGVTMFQLITGKLPRELFLSMKLPSYFADDLPPCMSEIISKCTRFNPEERYSSVRELKKDILNVKNQLKLNNQPKELTGQIALNNQNTKDKIAEFKNLFIGKFINNLSSSIRKSKPELSYKSMIITVWDNTEFACELAYVLAQSTNLNVLLADMDLLCPTIDLILNIKKYPEKIMREGILNESGLNIVLDSAARGTLTRESFINACIKRKEVSNLYILTGNYRLENYEYYSNESLTTFIDKSRQLFDVVILAVNRSIYDAFTVISLIKSDINIIPICAVVHKLREFNNYIVFLKDKQKIPLEKNKFVAFEYDAKVHLQEPAINEATQYNYLGSVRFCLQREKCRNQRVAYSQKMDKKVKEDYIRILRKIKILA